LDWWENIDKRVQTREVYLQIQKDILLFWTDKRKPIDDQPIETIDFIYNLLQDDRE
jgi:hypothetical protein